MKDKKMVFSANEGGFDRGGFLKFHTVAPNALVVALEDGNIYMYNVKDGNFKMYTGPVGVACRAGEFIADNKQLLVLYEDGSVRNFDLKTKGGKTTEAVKKSKKEKKEKKEKPDGPSGSEASASGSSGEKVDDGSVDGGSGSDSRLKKGKKGRKTTKLDSDEDSSSSSESDDQDIQISDSEESKRIHRDLLKMNRKIFLSTAAHFTVLLLGEV